MGKTSRFAAGRAQAHTPTHHSKSSFSIQFLQLGVRVDWAAHRRQKGAACCEMAAAAASRVAEHAEEADEEAGPLPINHLEKHGINPSDVAKLQAAGLYTVEGVSAQTAQPVLRGGSRSLPHTGCILSKEGTPRYKRHF